MSYQQLLFYLILLVAYDLWLQGFSFSISLYSIQFNSITYCLLRKFFGIYLLTYWLGFKSSTLLLSRDDLLENHPWSKSLNFRHQCIIGPVFSIREINFEEEVKPNELLLQWISEVVPHLIEPPGLP